MAQQATRMELAGVTASAGTPVTSPAIGSLLSLQGNALVLQPFPEVITTLFLSTYLQEFNILEIFTALSGMETETHCNTVSLDSLRKQARRGQFFSSLSHLLLKNKFSIKISFDDCISQELTLPKSFSKIPICNSYSATTN